MLTEKDSVLEKPPHFDPNNIILCFYAALYAATYLLLNFVQEMLGYTAATSGMVFSPAGLCTMIMASRPKVNKRVSSQLE
jgi:hypothetical protein